MQKGAGAETTYVLQTHIHTGIVQKYVTQWPEIVKRNFSWT